MKILAKQVALRNKAIDVAKAAWEAQGKKGGDISMTSLSLMTPDRPREVLGQGEEIGKLKDQVEAFKLLQPRP